MAKLTNAMREIIQKRAVENAFAAREKALAKAEDALAREAYNSVISKSERDTLSKVPDRWLCLESVFRFNVGGLDIQLRIEGSRLPVPSSFRHHWDRLGTIPHGDLCDRIQAHANALKDIRAERETAKRAVMSLLTAASTTNKLREIWPECEPFLPAPMPAPSPVPAIRIAEVNAMLGLPLAA